MKLETMIERVKEAGYRVSPKRDQTGRPRKTDVPRCPCGAMTASRAKARAHKCEAPETCQAQCSSDADPCGEIPARLYQYQGKDIRYCRIHAQSHGLEWHAESEVAQ